MLQRVRIHELDLCFRLLEEMLSFDAIDVYFQKMLTTKIPCCTLFEWDGTRVTVLGREQRVNSPRHAMICHVLCEASDDGDVFERLTRLVESCIELPYSFSHEAWKFMTCVVTL